MKVRFSTLNAVDLETLAAALRSGRLSMPFVESSLRRILTRGVSPETRESLLALAECGFDEAQMAIFIESLAAERSARKRTDEIVELVTTGPEAPGTTNRDTSVVVQELFSKARESVLVAGYAVYQGAQVFRTLAERMDSCTALQVQFFLDIPRPDGDTSDASIVVHKFMRRLRTSQWVEGCRLPDVFYDPRSVSIQRRSSLHAKCIVVDGKSVFVSSANFTQAGQERNVEVGVLIHSESIGRQLTRHFDGLVAAKLMQRASR